MKEANELELVISLPNGLQGFVQVTEISDAYTKKLNEQVEQEEPLKVREISDTRRNMQDYNFVEG